MKISSLIMLVFPGDYVGYLKTVYLWVMSIAKVVGKELVSVYEYDCFWENKNKNTANQYTKVHSHKTTRSKLH